MFNQQSYYINSFISKKLINHFMDKFSDDQAFGRDPGKPSPTDFAVYLPWACNQLQVDVQVVINRCYQNEYVSVAQTDRSKGKANKGKIKAGPSKDVFVSDEKEDSQSMFNMTAHSGESIVRINAVYDIADNLVEVKFLKTPRIPRSVLKIMTLILPFQQHLTTLTITHGLTRETIHELCKMIPISIITDLCLDNTVIAGANYDSLVENKNSIRRLSLARCSIDDVTAKSIASKLIYPLPASSSLIILNLSSNRITDVGAKYLAEVLRSNRSLGYINLAGNMLTDEGAVAILDTLIDFPLTMEELAASRSRHVLYLKDKSKVITRMMAELKSGDVDKRTVKRKTVGRLASSPISTARKGKLEKEGSLKSVPETARSLYNFESMYYDKAQAMAENLIGEFKDPFSSQNVYTQNGIIYCYGNNILSYLNFSYNNLSYSSVKKLLNVLRKQKQMDRKPRGLANVSVDGNYMPTGCMELHQVDDIIEVGLALTSRKLSGTTKKRPGSTRKEKWT